MKAITAVTAWLLAWNVAAYGQAGRDMDAAIAIYKSAPLCCGTLNAMTFNALEPGTKALALDEKSPAFAFEPSGKSYFAAFALPAGKALQLSARSAVFQNAGRGAAIFFPRIMLLDRSKAVIATVNWGDDKILHPGEAGGPDYIETVADLTAYPSARFLIVYTEGDRIGMTENLQHVVPESSVMAPVTGVASHVFFVEVPDPHLEQTFTPVLRSPIAPGTLVLDVH